MFVQDEINGEGGLLDSAVCLVNKNAEAEKSITSSVLFVDVSFSFF